MWRSSQHNLVTCGVVQVPVRPGGALCSSERGLSAGRWEWTQVRLRGTLSHRIVLFLAGRLSVFVAGTPQLHVGIVFSFVAAS